VAEDVGALARSLARDLREAMEEARASGRSTSEALRYGIRDVAEETKRGVAGGWSGHRKHKHGHGRPYRYGPYRPPGPPTAAGGGYPGRMGRSGLVRARPRVGSSG